MTVAFVRPLKAVNKFQHDWPTGPAKPAVYALGPLSQGSTAAQPIILFHIPNSAVRARAVCAFCKIPMHCTAAHRASHVPDSLPPHWPQRLSGTDTLGCTMVRSCHQPGACDDMIAICSDSERRGAAAGSDVCAARLQAELWERQPVRDAPDGRLGGSCQCALHTLRRACQPAEHSEQPAPISCMPCLTDAFTDSAPSMDDAVDLTGALLRQRRRPPRRPRPRPSARRPCCWTCPSPRALPSWSPQVSTSQPSLSKLRARSAGGVSRVLQRP